MFLCLNHNGIGLGGQLVQLCIHVTRVVLMVVILLTAMRTVLL